MRGEKRWVRIHKTLRVTPAMEAGKADHVWALEEIAGWRSKKGEREWPTFNAESLKYAPSAPTA